MWCKWWGSGSTGVADPNKITTTYRAGGLATEASNGKVSGSDGLARLLDGSIYGATAHAQGTG